VVSDQNHDQVGNRALGERFTQLVNFEGLKLAAGVTILSPFVPLLFMGEEYGETAPFQYFTSHADQNLVEAVRRGRKSEFESFKWKAEIPDPQAESTFTVSRLNHSLAQDEPHRTLRHFYQMLLRFRRKLKLGHVSEVSVTQYDSASALMCVLGDSSGQLAQLATLFHFSESSNALAITFPEGAWKRRIDSSELDWLGPGSTFPAQIMGRQAVQVNLQPRSFVVLELAHSTSE